MSSSSINKEMLSLDNVFSSSHITTVQASINRVDVWTRWEGTSVWGRPSLWEMMVNGPFMSWSVAVKRLQSLYKLQSQVLHIFIEVDKRNERRQKEIKKRDRTTGKIKNLKENQSMITKNKNLFPLLSTLIIIILSAAAAEAIAASCSSLSSSSFSYPPRLSKIKFVYLFYHRTNHVM